jgi:hypothetical protein
VLVSQAGRWRSTRLVSIASVMALTLALAAVPTPAEARPPVPVRDPVGLADGTVAADARSAMAAARQRGTRVEVMAERTESSQTFARPDGTFLLEESLRPRWVRRPDRSWVDADPTLRPAAGAISPVATTVEMTFSPGGSRVALARMRADGASLGLRWPTALPTPVVEGNVATYRDIAPHLDLRIVADVDGFTHLLVIRSRKALSNPLVREIGLQTELSGLSLRVREGTGVVEAVDAAGAVVFAGPSPMMWDSRGAAATPGKGERAERGSVDVVPRMAPVVAKVSAGRLTLVPDATLLNDPEAVFPLYVDPTWSKTTGKRNNWSLLRKSFPNSSFYNPAVGSTSSNDATHGIVRAGYVVDDRTYTDRSVFNMSTSAVRYKRINKATFSLTQSWSYYGCSSSTKPITELRSVSSFSSSTTWNTSWNSTKSGWGTVLATSNQIRKYGYSCGPRKVEYNVTNRVRQAAAAGSSSINIGLIARSETTGNWARFRNDSMLAIEYNTAPNAPKDLKVMGKACGTGSSRPYVTLNRPTFTAGATDPDPVQQSLTTRFHWWPSGQSRNNSVYVSGSSANPGTPESAAIPADKALADLTVYQWQAQTIDDVGDVTWSGVCELRTSLNPPASPTQVASSAYPLYNPANPGPGSGGVGVSGTFTISPPSAGLTEVVGYAYTLDTGVSAAAATTVAKNADGSAAVTLAPVRDGLNTLRVWSKDVADRFSNPVQYQFLVRPGNGPAARWVFDNAAARGEDATGHGNALSLSGASAAAGRAGVGSALTFNGSAAAATAAALTQPHPDTGAPLTVRTDATFTVSAWVRITATGGTNSQAAVSADGTRTSPYLLGYSGPLNRWIFRMAGSDVDNAALTVVSSDAAPVAGRWTHLAGTYDASTKTLRLFVMGVQQASTATLSGTGFHAGGPVTVGRSRWNGASAGWLNGLVDDVRVYSYLAPTTELAEAARPLPPVITFPQGDKATVGGTLQVRFDAGGDTNVTSFKYSTGTASLNQTVAAGTAGGTATVNLPASPVGELRVFAATVDGPRQSGPTSASGTVVGAPTVSGVVFDATTGTAVAGATVSLDPAGLQVTSGSNGAYSISGFAAGTYTLAANLGGQCGQAFATDVALTEALVVNIFLTPARDTFGYTCQEAPGTPFAPVAGAALALTGDDAVTTVSLPFSFPFYDETYTSAWVDTNGLISFRDPGGSQPGGTRTIPSPAAPNALIAAYWDDLVVDASASVRTETTGAAPEREFTVEWRNVHLKGDAAARLSVRATLHEQGFVLINYGGLDTPAERGLTAAVGVESPGGEIGVQYAYKQSALVSDTMIVFVRPLDAGAIETMNVTGTVVDAATGAPLAGVQVRLEPAERTVTTGSGGSFSFADLESGSYVVQAGTNTHCGKVDHEYLELETSVTLQLGLGPVADDYGYACLGGPRSFAPVSSQLALSGDDNNASISLPFPLAFYGETHTVAWVNTNGIIIFQPQPFPWYAPHEIPSVHDSPSSAIYPMWSDWFVDGSASVWTGTSGTAPNRTFAIEWRNVRYVDDSSARVSFQVTMAETTGVIGVAWKDISTTNAREKGSAAVVGIENTDGTIALPYSAFEEVVASGNGVVFTPGDPGLHTVSGTVTCSGSPAGGVTVLLGDQSAVTNAAGQYQFVGVAAGPDGLIATATTGACGGSVTAPVTAVRGEPQVVDLALVPVAQAPGYTVRVAATSMQPTSTVFALPGTDGGDDEYAPITPPFPVKLYGQTYSQAWLDTNGVLMFANRGFSDAIPFPIPSTEWSPNAAVYPLWDDWVVDSLASVRTGLTGTAPNRQWVVEWRNVHPFNMWQRVDFQVVFHESAGQITFSYNNIDATFVERGGAGLVGVENATSTAAIQFAYLMPVLRSGRGIVFTPN